MAEGKKLGIGILGAASIAKKNVKAIKQTLNGVGELLDRLKHSYLTRKPSRTEVDHWKLSMKSVA